MWETIKAGAIWFARLQVLGGAVWAALTAADLSPIITNQKYLTLWLIFSGLVTELSRRSNTYEDDDGHLLPRRQDQEVIVNVTNNSPPTSPLGPTSGDTK